MKGGDAASLVMLSNAKKLSRRLLRFKHPMYLTADCCRLPARHSGKSISPVLISQTLPLSRMPSVKSTSSRLGLPISTP